MVCVYGVGAGRVAGTQVRCVWSGADVSVKWCRCVCACVCVRVCVVCVCGGGGGGAGLMADTQTALCVEWAIREVTHILHCCSSRSREKSNG